MQQRTDHIDVIEPTTNNSTGSVRESKMQDGSDTLFVNSDPLSGGQIVQQPEIDSSFYN